MFPKVIFSTEDAATFGTERKIKSLLGRDGEMKEWALVSVDGKTATYEEMRTKTHNKQAYWVRTGNMVTLVVTKGKFSTK